MQTKKKSPKLGEIIPRIEEELEKVGSNLRPARRRTAKRAALNLLMQNYTEVLQILKRIQVQQKKYRWLEGRYSMKKVMDEFGSGPITDKKVEKAWLEQAEIRSSIKLNIKSLYVWVHQIAAIFRKSVPMQVPELGRIAFLRNKFITHLESTKFFESSLSTQQGLLFDKEFEKIEILFHSVFPSRSRQKKFSALMRDLGVHIPELQTEKNLYERAKIVYRNLTKLAQVKMRGRAETFLDTVGLRTQPPGEIAEALLVALKEYRQLKRL